MKLKLIPIISLSTIISIGLSLPARSQTVPCRAYTVKTGSIGYGFEEVNNCPIINGTFANSDWKIRFIQWEPAAYLYEATSLKNGKVFKSIDFNIQGTTTRPQYKFQDGNTLYVVSFRYSNPNIIRVEVYRSHQKILNQLFYRTSS